MDMRWSAILLIAVAVCLSWVDAPPHPENAALPSARVAHDAPEGVLAMADDLLFTREDIESFLAMPEVQASGWAELYSIAQIAGIEDLERGARLLAAVHLAAREAGNDPGYVAAASKEVREADNQWLLEEETRRIHDSVQDPTTAELHEEYRQLLPLLTRPEERSCRHLYVNASSIAASTRRSDRDARRVAQDLLEELRNGADFRLLVQRHSESDSAREEDPGFLPAVARDQLLLEFGEALWALGEGEVSGVVKGGGGYHLIHCLAISATRAPSFASQLPVLVARVRERKIGKATDDALVRAASLTHAEFNPAALAADATAGAVIFRAGTERATMGEHRNWVAKQPPELVEHYGQLENREQYYRDQYEQWLLVALARHEGLDQQPELRRRSGALYHLRLAEQLVGDIAVRKAKEQPVADETLRRFYEEHSGVFVEPFRAEVDQIRVTWPEGDGKEPLVGRMEEAERRAEVVAVRLRAGATRRDLEGDAQIHWYSAKSPQFLADMSEPGQRLLGPDVQYSSLPVLDATPGTVYGPIDETDHFLVVRLRSVIPSRFLGYDEVRAQVEAHYRSSQVLDLAYQNLESRLRKANFRFIAPARPIL